MTPISVARIIAARSSGSTMREHYWRARGLLGEISRARAPQDNIFWKHARADLARRLGNKVVPIPGETRERMDAAVQWILRAQAAAPDDGVSLGYFPCDLGTVDGWRASYPETTGYIITSLLAYSRTFGRAHVREAAQRMGLWEALVQMPSGAVQGGPVCTPANQRAAAFNTGMVLDGWCSLLADAPDEEILRTARRAADFLEADLDDQGYFRTNGGFVTSGEIKTYTCLCAWAMHRFGDLVGEQGYRASAVRSIEAAIRQQHPNGWFAHNCLSMSSAPLTHTIGYTLQGLLEVGVLSSRQDFVDSAAKAIDQISKSVQPTGYLPGRFFPDWTPASLSSCLTGSAQLAIVSYRLSDLLGEQRYRALGDRLLNYLKPLQATATGDAGIDGAIAGSFPLFGAYMRAGYPNWATKYYLDALMLQQEPTVAP